MKASEFKAKCLKVMDEVAETGDEVVITKNGKWVAKLVRCEELPTTLCGISKGTFKIIGDIIEPTYDEWTADIDNI